MIYAIKAPEGFKVMTELEFSRAYRAARESCGDSWSTFDIMKSWTAYQADPAGHFLSKPPYTTIVEEASEQQHQEDHAADCQSCASA